MILCAIVECTRHIDVSLLRAIIRHTATHGFTQMQTSKVAFSVTEFCARHGICRSLFYTLLREGKGPTIMHVGKRRLVSIEAEAEWRKKMERRRSLPRPRI